MLDWLRQLVTRKEKPNYGAKAGSVIAGNLARGGDGKFTSAGNATAANPDEPKKKRRTSEERRVYEEEQRQAVAQRKVDRQARTDQRERERQADREERRRDRAEMRAERRRRWAEQRAERQQRKKERAADRARRDQERVAKAKERAATKEARDKERAERKAQRDADRQARLQQRDSDRQAKVARQQQRDQERASDRQRKDQERQAKADERRRASEQRAQERKAKDDERRARQQARDDERKATVARRESERAAREEQRRVERERKNTVSPEAKQQADTAKKFSSGAELSEAEEELLIRNGLAKRDKEGVLVLTSAGRKATTKEAQPSVVVFKDAKGRYRWVSISSTAFQDRDKQIVSTKALADDVARADASGQYGPLRWWHVPGLDIGDCDFNMMHGKCLIESGTFRDERYGAIVAKEAPNLHLSLGFRHAATEPDADGVYHHIYRFERSLLPAGRASNLFTSFVVTETAEWRQQRKR